jgi:uroporphyrinogen-III synthase/siroheme synthase
MNTLTLVELSDVPWCELTIQAFRALLQADVVICDKKYHQPYLKHVHTRCSVVEFTDQANALKSLENWVIKQPEQTQQIVCLWTAERHSAQVHSLINSKSDHRGLSVDTVHRLSARIPRLSQLPLFAEDKTAASRLFVNQADCPTQLERTAGREHPNYLVCFGMTTPLPTLAQQVLNMGLSAASTMTLISSQFDIEISSHPLHQVLQHASEPINTKDLVIVGDAPDLNALQTWRAQRPLLGRRFMTTRALEQQRPLNDLLSSLGAQTISLAVSEFTAINSQAQREMYQGISQYDWIILTSVNAVHFFLDGFKQRGGGIAELANIKIACVGPVTAAAVESRGLSVDLAPTEFTSEGLLNAFAQTSLKGIRILLPRAQVARSVLPDSLRALQAHVDVIATYQKRSLDSDTKFWQQVNALALDGVLFCASSTVCALESWIDTAEEASFKRNVPAFCIGPSTRGTALKMNYAHVPTAVEHTVPGLVDCVVQYYLAPL